MKKLILPALLLVAFSCSEATDSESPTADEITRSFIIGKSISALVENIGTGVEWSDGKSTVIRFDGLHNGPPNTYDLNYTETLLVEVPEGVSEFSFSTMEEMLGQDIELYYIRSCECSYKRFVLTAVEVSAVQQLDDRWFMEFNIQASSEGEMYELKDQGIYQK